MNKTRKHQSVLNILINIQERTRGLLFFLFAAFLMMVALPVNAAALTYSNDTNVLLSTPGITLVILAGSVADGLVVNAGSVAVTLSAGESLTLTSPQSLTAVAGGGVGTVSPNCISDIETNTITQQSGTGTYTLTPSGAACIRHALGSGGGGGGGSGSVSPTISLALPNGGNILTGGSVVGISWSSANGAFVKYRVSYSADNGNTWVVIAASNSGTSYSWTVPSASTTQARIKIEGLDAGGNVLALATSASVFSINGSSATPPVVVPPVVAPSTVVPAPSTDSTATGDYSPSVAFANTADINTNFNLSVPSTGPVDCESGTLIKGSLSAVYYCGADGKRYVFSNERVYKTWYADFAGVKIISDLDLAKIPLGGNVTYRPGVKMVKAQTDPKVYAVSRGGLLRWIGSEAIAKQLYGNSWNKTIDYIPDAFWTNYKFGDPITE